MFKFVIVAVSIALAAGQVPGPCENACVSQNARNGALYQQLFQGSISQVNYNSVCSDIQGVSGCLANCGSNSNSTGPNTTGPNSTGSSSTGSSSTGSDCLTVSMPIYTAACSAGYQQFSQLGQCYQQLNSGYSAAQQQCQQQCARQTGGPSRRRRQAVQNALVNGNSFCVTNCGLSQQLQTIQSQCSPWVAQFSQIVSQTYNQLYQLSPTCLAL
ncbi:hypothetical protein FO519_004704 [Halicephalobus sp. NKZ332]|nr:hypothetical protein FO519_004704 [Halicephalobus sp. NKZ332]